jgi:hypothetical protein
MPPIVTENTRITRYFSAIIPMDYLEELLYNSFFRSMA